MPAPPKIRVRGIRQPIKAGYVVGRVTPGTGDAQLVDMATQAAALAAQGVLPGAPPGTVGLTAIADQRFLANLSGGAATPVATPFTSIVTVGTITTGTWNGTVIAGQYGGTGVANTGKTITLGGSLTTSGAFDTTITVSATTNSTLPAGTHTLAGLDVAQTWSALQTISDRWKATESSSSTGINGVGGKYQSQNTDATVNNWVRGFQALDSTGASLGQVIYQVLDHTNHEGDFVVSTRANGAGNPTEALRVTGTTKAVTTGIWNATKIGLAYGGTNADLSATGGASQVLQQASAGAAITVGQLTFAHIGSGTTAATATGLTISGGILTGNTTIPGSGQISSVGFLGIGGTPAAQIDTRLDVSVAAIGINGTGLRFRANTVTDTASGAGTIAEVTANSIAATTFATSSAAITLTQAETLRISAPVAGTNITIGTAISLYLVGGLRIDDLIRFSGLTSSFPALKRASAVLECRLADDSAYAAFAATTLRVATARTVATLPAAGTAGRFAYVTDALAPAFLTAIVGGGAVVTPVFDDGTNWIAI